MRNLASGAEYRMVDGKPDFLGAEATATTGGADLPNRIKSALKRRFGRHYPLITEIVSPVMTRIHWPTLEPYWRYFIRSQSAGKDLVLQIGSGNLRIGDEIVNVDIQGLSEVDIIADAARLPFANDSVDMVVSVAMLEHVPDPEGVLAEAARVLKPGGTIVTVAPFLVGFHASPDDYTRWTGEGLRTMHRRHGFEPLQTFPIAGPTSSLLWVLQEWLAMALSFNTDFLYAFWFVAFSLLLFPFKVADLWLLRHPQAYRIGSSFLYAGRKASPPEKRWT